MFAAVKHMDALREAPTYVLEDVYGQLDVLENMVRAYRLLVHRPDGSLLNTRPPPLDDHLRERFVAKV